MPQPRPSGPSFVVTAEWIAWVKERMAELGVSQTDLAECAGVSQAAISDLLRGEVAETRVMPQINARLGGILPYQITTISPLDEAKSRLDAAWPDLDERERSLVAQLVDALQRSRNRD